DLFATDVGQLKAIFFVAKRIAGLFQVSGHLAFVDGVEHHFVLVDLLIGHGYPCAVSAARRVHDERVGVQWWVGVVVLGGPGRFVTKLGHDGIVGLLGSGFAVFLLA